MKKIFILGLIVFSVMLVSSQAFAISGPCSNCHTMHNSQNGTLVNTTAPNGAPMLLRGDCIYCHGVAGATQPGPLGGPLGYYPKVDDPGTPSAAGFFTPVAGNITDQHNVVYAGAPPETTIPNPLLPPGSTGAATLGGPLTCAGSAGCHGRPYIDTSAAADGGMGAMNGFHHNSIAGGVGYRFLRIASQPLATITTSTIGTPVGGKGSPTWEIGNPTVGNHNVYQGGNGTGGGTGASGESISRFCSRCHGDFHGAFGAAGGPFNRHPVDWSLPAVAATGRDMVANATLDMVNNPFAYGDVSTLSTNVALTNTGAQVMCLSCHRSHGSAQPDLLRFDYATQIAGQGVGTNFGCLGCHYAQR